MEEEEKIEDYFIWKGISVKKGKGKKFQKGNIFSSKRRSTTQRRISDFK
jgi:hypothetical protein